MAGHPLFGSLYRLRWLPSGVPKTTTLCRGHVDPSSQVRPEPVSSSAQLTEPRSSCATLAQRRHVPSLGGQRTPVRNWPMHLANCAAASVQRAEQLRTSWSRIRFVAEKIQA
jgi:hypothetical protein